MIFYTPGTDLFLRPALATSMFSDRKKQFSDRLGWPVNIDFHQLERDQYDKLNPIYVIVQADDGSHAGSMRLMPTTGRTMINEYFLETLGGVPINDRKTWECTRFCISQGQSRRTAIALFAAAGFLMRELGVEDLIAVFDEIMLRVYRNNSVLPELLGQQQKGEEKVFAGRWRFDREFLEKLTRLSCFSADVFELGLANSTISHDESFFAA